MDSAAKTSHVSISNQIKALGLPAAETRKALNILALSEAFANLLLPNREPAGKAQPTGNAA
ncbi:MAG: hypothetical protein FJY56_01760 [Betaproteobacteria bacterium]|nr:hypothetical protein [Betaproteobacteria bacterium]